MATDFGKEFLMQMAIWNAEKDMGGKCRVYCGSDALMSAAIYCQMERE